VNELVRESYDKIASAYAAQRDEFKNDSYLARLAVLLVPGAKVLDVGCGAGVPVDRYLLAKGLKISGIDISATQIELARRSNPAGEYAVRDMLGLVPGEYNVDAVVSFYTIFHAPRETHATLLWVLRSFLTESGLLLATMGSTEWEGIEEFHGAEMFWSHYDATTNRSLVEAAGFEVLLDEIDTSGGERHQVLLAKAI
jgi:cyclopropane fatty-acyl-phospholipid synthase-like methyltransferase